MGFEVLGKGSRVLRFVFFFEFAAKKSFHDLQGITARSALGNEVLQHICDVFDGEDLFEHLIQND